MYEQPDGKKKEIIAALAVLIVIVAIVTTVSVSAKKKAVATAVVTQPVAAVADTAASTTSPVASGAVSYKDGNYRATGSYDSPNGTEDITIQITLASDIITATSAQSGANDPEGEEYQSQFIAAYKQLVVGKNIDSIHLGRVSGSSLTTLGFTNALDQIKQKAQGA